MRRRVILESPYAGDVECNVAYARRCLRDSLGRGEAPIASHLLHTQVLDDGVPEERRAGIEAGLEWLGAADALVVYCNLGMSGGMSAAVRRAHEAGVPVEVRFL